MRVSVEQRHIDNGLRCGSAHPVALAIKDELDRTIPVPQGYLRVERVVSVSSTALVTEHRIIKRKGREETDLAFQKYWFGSKQELDLRDPAFDFMGDFDNGRPTTPTTIEITLDEAKNG